VLVPALVFGVIGIILIAVARFWPRSAVEVKSQSRAGVTSLSGATELGGAKLTRHPNDRAWIAHVDPDLPGTLDLDERRRLVEGLALVGEPWCATALALAYREEGDTLRDVIVAAIGQCAGEVEPTLAAALRSERPSERLLSLEGYAKRGDLATLEEGLADPDVSVALVAALSLIRANESARVDRYVGELTDAERAQTMRDVLAVLA